MRKTIFTFLAIAAFVSFSIAQDDSYMMFENTRIKPKTDKLKAFGKAMKEHNKKFHNTGPYHANVWSVAVGQHTGEVIWSMGPCTFSDLDSRPSGEDHFNDWMDNVMPNVACVGENNLWRLDKEHSYNPDNKRNNKLSIRIYDLEDWQGYRFKELLSKVKKVYEEKNYDETYGVYWSQFDVNTDQDVAIVWGFDKWARFDEDPKFKKDFEEINGEGSWQKFLEELRGTIKSARDEVWELIPELSGSQDN
jgi:hypothetical protein